MPVSHKIWGPIKKWMARHLCRKSKNSFKFILKKSPVRNIYIYMHRWRRYLDYLTVDLEQQPNNMENPGTCSQCCPVLTQNEQLHQEVLCLKDYITHLKEENSQLKDAFGLLSVRYQRLQRQIRRETYF